MTTRLRTRRLLLRPFTPDDAKALHALNSDPEVLRYINGGTPLSMEETVQRILPGYIASVGPDPSYGFWAAVELATGGFVGWFHLRPFEGDTRTLEIGYRLTRSVWGRGLATEGSRGLIDKAFGELDADCVVGTSLVANLRSRRVMERLGMNVEQAFVYPAEHLPEGWGEDRRRGVKYMLRREDAGPQSAVAGRECG